MKHVRETFEESVKETWEKIQRNLREILRKFEILLEKLRRKSPEIFNSMPDILKPVWEKYELSLTET